MTIPLSWSKQIPQANSSGQFPSFLKQLLKSHLSGKFYLGLPKKFCDVHMPSHDDTLVLVDENEHEYNMKYSVRKNRLSGGWRGFSVAHRLVEGDALVFHLIEPCKFRVYIIRAGKLTENDVSTSVQTCDFPNIKPISAGKSVQLLILLTKTLKMEDHVYVNSLDVNSHHETKRARLISDAILEGNRYSESVIYFKDVKGFEDFKIQLDGLILDSEIPTNLRTKYYNLCCSQKSYLHDHLIKGLSSKLAVAVISEITNIADAVRSSDLATSIQHLECWEKTLKAFENLGMAVGFLVDRVQKLVIVSREYQSIVETKRALAEKLDFEFQMLARAPW
ncbi:B3 domain-containing protein os01g0234100 [Phtheirospermum japonicum]|uniref:B3 domain-containing protein os01g0234100 n=1 Tax=Phtheirospermum japonicum TaxID=374723 RepID=A0A830BA40_9LAMI|nr:B3 domain-containing protein os01g0234100 [Phtheirospermum japonicum]